MTPNDRWLPQTKHPCMSDVESVSLGFIWLHRIKKQIGATTTQTLVVVTTHINHPFLFIFAQKLWTKAGKQRPWWKMSLLAQLRPLPHTFLAACVSGWGADKVRWHRVSAQSKQAGQRATIGISHSKANGPRGHCARFYWSHRNDLHLLLCVAVLYGTKVFVHPHVSWSGSHDRLYSVCFKC